jgi:peptidyl-prolyl cis-trans isomerase SurA
MRKKYLLWFAGLGMWCLACKSSDQPIVATPSSAEPVLFSIQDEPTTLKEFLYVYNKNNFTRDSVNLAEDFRQYLDLYINFKLKVQEAKDAGLHQEQAFLSELEGYKKELAKPYLSEKSVTEQLIQEAYDRLATEINASHILIGIKSEDTLAAWNKIMKIREQALNGEDFHQLARQHSEDPSAGMNSGNLGYFTALQMVYPFENAAYQTPVGEISNPVRTNFGYHILKVHDARPSQGKVKVAHIMIRAGEDASEEDKQKAKEKISEIHQRLQDGADWSQLVSQFSEDHFNKKNGGELEWFGTGNMVPSFEEAAFALKEKGQISKPVRTPYGWHIVRLMERQGLPPFEEIRNELSERVSRDSRAQLQENALMERLRRENNVAQNREHIDLLLEKANKTLLSGRWDYKPDSLEAAMELFLINEEAYTLGAFQQWLSRNAKAAANINPEDYLKQLFQRWQQQSLLAYEEAHLAEKYDDYRLLVQEYHDGILLFQLMDEKVWTRALEDTAGLERWFKEHRDRYQWNERARSTIFSAASAETLSQVEEALARPPYIWKENKLDLSAAGQELLPASVTQTLDHMLGYMRQDTSAVLQVYVPKKDSSSSRLIEQHLQAQALAPSRYQFQAAASAEKLVRLISSSPKALEKRFNRNSSLALQVLEGAFEQGEHPVLEAVSWQPGDHRLQHQGRHYLVRIEEVLPSSPKRLDEVRGKVISDYQQALEEAWISALREKYTVTIDQALLQQTLRNLDEN